MGLPSGAKAPGETRIAVEPRAIDTGEGAAPGDRRERVGGGVGLVEPAKPVDVKILLSAAKGQKDAVQSLLDSDANVFAAEALGRTALHLAAVNGHRDVANMLISAAAEDAVVALLLLKGANAAARDKEGKTPLDLATSDCVRKRLVGTMPPVRDERQSMSISLTPTDSP